MLDKFNKLLVVALKPEWIHLKKAYRIQPCKDFPSLSLFSEFAGVALLQVGFGLKNAQTNFLKFCDEFSCNSVLHFGSAGALENGHKIGDLFLTNKIICGKEEITLDSNKILELKKYLDSLDSTFFQGDLLSSPVVLKNKTEKLNEVQKYSVSAVDMESFPIAKICKAKGIDYISIRSFFDALEDDIESLNSPFDPEGNIKTHKLAMNVLKRPKLIFKLPEFQRRAALVNQSLKSVIEWYINQAFELNSSIPPPLRGGG